jgi:hypothetical protein
VIAAQLGRYPRRENEEAYFGDTVCDKRMAFVADSDGLERSMREAITKRCL